MEDYRNQVGGGREETADRGEQSQLGWSWFGALHAGIIGQQMGQRKILA
jgi:hypothetical protein